MEETKEVLEDDSYYDDLYQKIVDYLTSGKVHSTLVGIIINLDGDKGTKDLIEAKIFADYIINFLKKVD
jgi:hypothetical protein